MSMEAGQYTDEPQDQPARHGAKATLAEKFVCGW